ncbi:hypothetical protein F4680DRAFT_467069 [Xylaria scruposa]|nr:hypothetical protein F4680DRAFT_467069 [Xylaria scruposa]
MEVLDGSNKVGRFGILTSPWAERYGLFYEWPLDLLKEDLVLHSGLAPVLPTLPPRHYNKLPRKREFDIANTFGEIDSILVTEEYQRNFHGGLATWNLPPFNHALSWDGSSPFPGGHRPNDSWQHSNLLQKYHQERVEVNEDSWFPFFKKDRWYDFRIPDDYQEDMIERGDGSKWSVRKWSVNNERIWRHLRFILELANRMLMAMIRDQNEWLEMVVFGRIQLWYEMFGDVNNAAQHRKDQEDNRIIMPFVLDMHYSQRLNRVLPIHNSRSEGERIAFVNNLLKNHAWSFMPSVYSSRGVTMPVPSNQGFISVARLNVKFLILLCGGTISVAERCILYPRIAITRTSEDELMHAIYMNRIALRENLSEEVMKEINSATMSMHRNLREPHERPALPNERSRHLMIVLSLTKYPSIFGGSGTNTGFDKRNFPEMDWDARIPTYFLPAALLWRLQSKAFWDAPVNGKTAFFFPRLFTSAMQLDLRTTNWNYEDVVVDPDAAGDVKYSDVIARWNEQMQFWAARRPWYRDAYAVWKKTAWGCTAQRIRIEKFIAAFRQKNEFECAEHARFLTATLPKVFVGNLPNDDERYIPKYGARDGPQLWLFHCLGYTISIHQFL